MHGETDHERRMRLEAMMISPAVENVCVTAAASS
jgi:hypothetical protein